MITELIIKWLIRGVVVAAIVGSAYSLYSSIRQSGFKEAAVIYQQVIDDQQKLIDTKLKNIEILSSTLVTQNKTANTQLANNVSSILSKVKGVPLVVVKDDKCNPSLTFSNTLDAVNKRVNDSIRESQK